MNCNCNYKLLFSIKNLPTVICDYVLGIKIWVKYLAITNLLTVCFITDDIRKTMSNMGFQSEVVLQRKTGPEHLSIIKFYRDSER